MKIRDGYKLTEVGVIPIEWGFSPLGDVAFVNKSSLGSLTDPAMVIDYIDIESVKTGKIEKFATMTFASAPSRARRIVSESDILLSTVRPYLRAIAFVDITTPHMTVCSTGFATISSYGLVPRYAYQFILSDIFIKQLEEKMVGSNYPAVNSSDVSNAVIAIPPLPEQQKIADILSTVDEHIGETEELIEKTKTLKQGMMQRLLTKGIGHTEFKETEIGRIPATWRIGCMGESIKLLSGYPFSSEYFNDAEEGIRIVRIRDINNPSTATYFSGTFDENFLLSDGDCIIGMDGDFNICKWQGGPALLNQRLCKVIEIPSGPTVDFVYHVMGKILSGIQAQTAATTVKHLSVKDINKALFPLPPLSEQRIIADILTTVDSQIDVYQTKLDAINRLKSGLMQQLLTGRIRVKV
jgi:type I restriction enzyme S subunit